MYRHFLKRVFDLFGSIILFPFVMIVITIFGLLIKMEDHGPIFYIADRLGKNGKNFKMYKLRSMKVNAPDLRNPDGSTYCSSSDKRLTKWGKFVREKSIDELPQIINVLFGNMSFIGPRPDLPEHIYYYNEVEKKKLLVLPGITGYSQAHIRNSAEWKIRLKNDVYYEEHLSFKLDIVLIFQTFKLVLGNKNIYSVDQSKNISLTEREVPDAE